MYVSRQECPLHPYKPSFALYQISYLKPMSARTSPRFPVFILPILFIHVIFRTGELKSLKRLAQVSAMQDEPDHDGCADEGRDRIQGKNVLTARQMREQIG